MLTIDDEYHPNADHHHANGQQDNFSADKSTNVERKTEETEQKRYASVNAVSFLVLVHWWSLWLSTKKASRCFLTRSNFQPTATQTISMKISNVRRLNRSKRRFGLVVVVTSSSQHRWERNAGYLFFETAVQGLVRTTAAGSVSFACWRE